MRNLYEPAANNTVEDLANTPSGGSVKQWLAGMALPVLIIAVSAMCMKVGRTPIFGTRGSVESVELVGRAGFWLAVSYMALGAFLHFHFFWGLSERLWRFCEWLKVLSLLVFVPSFGFALYWQFFRGSFGY